MEYECVSSTGNAEVYFHCREVCAMPGGIMELDFAAAATTEACLGSGWFKIDKKGRIVTRLQH